MGNCPRMKSDGLEILSSESDGRQQEVGTYLPQVLFCS